MSSNISRATRNTKTTFVKPLRYHTEITDTLNELLTSDVDKCWKASEYKTRLVQCDFFRVVPLCWTMTVHFHTNRCDIRHHRCVYTVPILQETSEKKGFSSRWVIVGYCSIRGCNGKSRRKTPLKDARKSILLAGTC